MKKILFGNAARQGIKKGIDTCCKIVGVSMGPYGQNVIIYNGANTEINRDGVSIAHQVKVKDETEQAGVRLAQKCAQQTDEEAGDATTTTLVLLQAVLDEVLPDEGAIAIAKEPSIKLRERLFKEANEVLANVDVKKVESSEDVYNIALTSSLDEDIAKCIEEVYEELGPEAQVSIEETRRDVLEKEITKGIKFESKRAEDKMLKAKDKEILTDCHVLVLDKVETNTDIEEFAKRVSARGGNEMVVIANQFSRPVLLSILQTRDFNIIPVEYKMLLPIDDIQTYVGDEPVEKIIITGESTTIIGGKGDVSEPVKVLKDRLEKEESQYERENLKNRIASLTGSIATIRIGKNTDEARDEYVKSLEDALGAVSGAYEEGYCKGGGNALKEASVNASEVMKRICEAPYKKIRENAGFEFDTLDTVIDSFKSVRLSLLNAISTGTSILTSGGALIEYDDET